MTIGSWVLDANTLFTLLILCVVSVERSSEQWFADRNVAALKKAGAIETGAGHYPWLVGALGAWLLGIWILAWTGEINVWFTVLFFLSMALKLRVILTLGKRWTARIVTVPGEKLVDNGAYRFIKHPNYFFLMGEIIFLPLAFGLQWYAALFAVIIGGFLVVRIKEENQALDKVRSSTQQPQSA